MKTKRYLSASMCLTLLATPIVLGACSSDEATGGDPSKNEQTKNEQTKNEQTKNEQTKNEQTKNEQTKNEQTKNEQTRTGETRCGSVTCQAGQYCVDGVLSICKEGCLSDINCAENQFCFKEETSSSHGAVGNCLNNKPTPTKDCTSFVQKCTACGEAEAACESACKVITAECVSCTVETSGCQIDSCQPLCGSR